MYFTPSQWNQFLLTQDVGIGFAFSLAGVICLYFGRLLSGVVVVANLALVGLFVAPLVASSLEMTGATWLMFTALCAWALARAGWSCQRPALMALGAAAGSVLVAFFMAMLGFGDGVITASQPYTFLCLFATAVVLFDETAIGLTTVEGGFLLVSGLAILARDNPAIAAVFNESMHAERFFLPFSLAVAIITGFLTQQTELHNEDHNGRG